MSRTSPARESGRRAIILHVDDLGMCQATLLAFADLIARGLPLSASVMVPCPWFPAAADFCRRHPQLDVGVHLTLTSEWRGYRWAPLSTCDPASGLLDEQGFAPRDPERLRAAPAAVAGELRHQLARARAAGIEVSHLDGHMLAFLEPAALPAYLQLGRDAGLPLLLWRPGAAGARPYPPAGLPAVRRWQRHGLPLVDAVAGLPWDRPHDRGAQLRDLLDAAPPGLTHLFLHPACDTPELRAIAPDWRSRVADYRALRDPAFAAYLRRSDLRVVGYRALREAMSASRSALAGAARRG